MRFLTFDFETKAIGPRPQHMPPLPVGMAYKINEGESEYLAWGHGRGTNNATMGHAKAMLEAAVRDPEMMFVAHNARFDVEVAAIHLGVEIPWNRVLDTLAQASLCYPLAPTLSLKPLCDFVFGMAPSEQDAVRAWLVEHGIVNRADKGWGAQISQAPVEIVAPYACGDTDRTFKLCRLLSAKIMGTPQEAAIIREAQLNPILIGAEQRGIRVNRDGLAHTTRELTALVNRLDAIIRVILGAPHLNVDANDDLADAIERAGKSAGFPKTATGKRSTSKEALEMAVADMELRELLKYRSMAATYLRTFAEPWMEASNYNGRIYPSWNSVRGEIGGGARTGRLSCHHPNLMNVPGKPMKAPKPDLAPLPNLREYLLPEEGHAWISGDFNSQELRILAHFAEGKLEQMYKDTPDLDLHAKAAEMISSRIGRPIERKATKVVAFSLIYGAGNATMGQRLGTSVDEAANLRNAYYDALPGVRELIDDVRYRARQNLPVRTVGGRNLFAPLDAGGRPKDYALVNYLIQGSAADQTKQTIIDWDRIRGDALFLTTVHDEINISAPLEHATTAARDLESRMNSCSIKLSVPMRSDVKVGVNWGDCGK